MHALRPDETVLVGSWVQDGTDTVADAICERIDWLVNTCLKRLGDSEDGWQSVYVDPADGRLWARTYPQGETHGGGPATLTCITGDEARKVIGEFEAT